MPLFDEEVFGPVAAMVEASDEADAIRSLTRVATDSVPTSGPETSNARRCYRDIWRAAKSSSTEWSPRTRGYRSEV
jgi:acyl-CoA reductase-like NAD-dependent aldehyde dehydrogenase